MTTTKINKHSTNNISKLKINQKKMSFKLIFPNGVHAVLSMHEHSNVYANGDRCGVKWEKRKTNQEHRLTPNSVQKNRDEEY